MSYRDGRKDRARRRIQGQVRVIGGELLAARELSGLSRRAVSTATGVPESAVRRLELGLLRELNVARLALVADAVGLEPSIRLYPGGDPLRDAAQNALLERLRLRVSRSLTWRREVPLPGDRDQRSWDAVITKPPLSRPVDAETRLRDFQALERRLNLKMRDGNVDSIILLVADSRNNRAALRSAPEAWKAAFPISSRQALTDVGAGRLPDASALIVL
jgi:transcriptional regulator with XRE-family HTH domain